MEATGVIFDIQRYAIHDGPGIRTTVFLKGCPLRCPWCHNPEGIGTEPEQVRRGKKIVTLGRRESVQSVMEEITRDITFYEESGGGATFSGGEPMMQIGFLEELLAACRARGIHAAVDTSGHAPWEDFERVRGLIDLFLFDIKLADCGEHLRHTGVSNGLILENLRRLDAAGASIIARVPLIPGITDTDGNLRAIADLLADLDGVRTVSLLPYNEIGEDKIARYGWEKSIGPFETQSDADLRSRGRIFEEHGFDARYGG